MYVSRAPTTDAPREVASVATPPPDASSPGLGPQAMLGGQQWRQSVLRSSPMRVPSVGRPQQSHVTGRNQLITLPARAGCAPLDA